MKNLSSFIKYLFLFSFLLINTDVIGENRDNINYKITTNDCDTLFYIIGEFRVEKIVKINNGHLIYLTNSTRDKIYTVISIKWKNKQFKKLFTDSKKIREGEIYIFRLDFINPQCKDEIIIGDKYLSTTYNIEGKKIFLPKAVIKGELVLTSNLNDLFYTDKIYIGKKYLNIAI
jgi:hypothetical protein